MVIFINFLYHVLGVLLRLIYIHNLSSVNSCTCDIRSLRLGRKSTEKGLIRPWMKKVTVQSVHAHNVVRLLFKKVVNFEEYKEKGLSDLGRGRQRNLILFGI